MVLHFLCVPYIVWYVFADFFFWWTWMRYLLNSFKAIEMFCFWNKAPYNFLQQRVSNLLSHELENLDMEV